ncbi:MAG: ribonucleotide reductase subunit alpha [Betaproteobacteria bacterium]|nr:ribonucleotide reductase subunit alpha [Betaproteobacteria bacterium]
MNITCFDDLITAARSQPEPQTLLMVFVDVELPPDASPQERARFEQGQGGALSPRMCLDRAASELTDWPSLAAEADQQSASWRMVLTAALSGRDGQAAKAESIEQALNRMVMGVHQGQIQGGLIFDRQGQAVHFT